MSRDPSGIIIDQCQQQEGLRRHWKVCKEAKEADPGGRLPFMVSSGFFAKTTIRTNSFKEE
jgi:hypothetical protein